LYASHLPSGRPCPVSSGAISFQHHHWDIKPSMPIDASATNTSDYTWSLNGNGGDSNGSWSAYSQSKTVTNGAQVRISAPTTVSLKQTTPPGMNKLPATGSSKATDWLVWELTWPSVTWSPNAGTPSSITYRDTGQPTYQLVTTPVPSSQNNVLLLVQSIAVVPGVGGQDWTTKTQFFQKPAAARALAWWAWTINLS
jgi:hypothetical protein